MCRIYTKLIMQDLCMPWLQIYTLNIIYQKLMVKNQIP